MLKPIFICSGNICRSPMAERLLSARARERGIPAMSLSMGTLDIDGQPASRTAIEALAEVGISLDGHRSQGLNAGLLRMATHILVMEQQHADAVVAIDHALAARITLFGRYDADTDSAEIEDPVGMPLDAFRECRDRLDRCVASFLRTATVT